jgi:hypothetical protein
LIPHLYRHEILIFYDEAPNFQEVHFRIFRSILCIVRKQPLSSVLTRLPCEPLSSQGISASTVDADESIIHTDYGLVRTVIAESAGLIGINISVVDFDPDSGVPMEYLVA